jgi:hypothetical protein
MMSDIDWSEVFYYDETSPSCLRWRINKGRKKVGDHVGYENLSRGKRYWKTKVNQKCLFVHKIIWELHNGPTEYGYYIDHINRESWDNRISNLRLVTTKTNSQNRNKYKNNKTGITGVYYRKRGKYSGYASSVRSDNSKTVSRWFSCQKFGEELAKLLAEEWRNKMLFLLNNNGQNYTKGHGT